MPSFISQAAGWGAWRFAEWATGAQVNKYRSALRPAKATTHYSQLDAGARPSLLDSRGIVVDECGSVSDPCRRGIRAILRVKTQEYLRATGIAG